jgi:hypothetical protein
MADYDDEDLDQTTPEGLNVAAAQQFGQALGGQPSDLDEAKKKALMQMLQQSQTQSMANAYKSQGSQGE